MSIWLLIAAGVLAWTVVSVAFALWIGRLLRARRCGGTVDFVPFAGVPYDQAKPASQHPTVGGRRVRLEIRGQSAGENEAA